VGQQPSRRSLDFRNFDAVIHDVESLSAGGYEKAGNWDLAQVCGHLAEWMRFPLDGFPRAPAVARLMLWLMRNTMGRQLLQRTLAQLSMSSGGPTIPDTIPPSGGNSKEAVERLRQSASRFQAHAGPIHPSPLFGEMSREELTQLQLIHCAHHLSFLVPKTPPATG
jgi:hypothetical protein